MGKRVRVVVKLVVEVDAEEWNAAYGCGDKASEIRKDVKSYLLNQVSQSPGVQESSGTVDLG